MIAPAGPETLHSGLTSSEAARRLAQYGPNEDRAPGIPRWRQVVGVVASPLVGILLVAALVNGFLGDWLSTGVIVTMVALGSGLNYWQSVRSTQAIKHLSELAAPQAVVLRDGQWTTLPRREVVPGDVARLTAGDLVPADGTLIEASGLHLQEAALTGESLPVERGASGQAEERRVFAGTSVVTGYGTMLVQATGASTVLGDIGRRLTSRPPETEFERGMRSFSLLITRTVVALVVFVFLVGAIQQRAPIDSVLFAVALAVGLTPEFLPMILAVVLARAGIRMAADNVVVKRLEAMQNFGSIDVLCSDKTGTLTTGQLSLVASLDPAGSPSPRPLDAAALNAGFQAGIRSPLDSAILEARPLPSDAPNRLAEVPFDFERRRLSVLVKDADGPLLITKGAPESVVPICTELETADGVGDLTDAQRAQVEAVEHELSNAGQRVLAVATRRLETERATVADEMDMTLVGFIGFADRPLPDAAEAIENLRQAGVRVLVISGDNQLVTRHVCAEVGLDGEIVQGPDVDRMDDTALGVVAERVAGFARVTPAQKTRVLTALKARGHVVGYIGDGINDAPALHAADVGIAAPTAVDVARDAADIVMLRPGLRVLLRGIMEGRRAFGNIIKYLLMGTSSNFGNVISMAVAAAVLPFLPMLPTQILLNNFLYDVSQLAIPTDNVDAAFTSIPRRWSIDAIQQFMLVVGPISSVYDFLTFGVLLFVFNASESTFQSGWFVESLVTQTLVLFVIRTADLPWKNKPSRPLLLAVVGVVSLGLALPYSGLGTLVGLVPLPPLFLVYVLVASLSYLAIVQAIKRRVLTRLLG